MRSSVSGRCYVCYVCLNWNTGGAPVKLAKLEYGRLPVDSTKLLIHTGCFGATTCLQGWTPRDGPAGTVRGR